MKMFTSFLVISLIATSLSFSASATSEDVKCSNMSSVPLEINFGCHSGSSDLTSSDTNRSKCYLTWPKRVELPNRFLLFLLVTQTLKATSSIFCDSPDICTLQLNNPNADDPSSFVLLLCKLLKGTSTGMPDTSIVKTTTTIADSPKSEKSYDPKLLKGTLTGMPDTSIVKTTTTIADSPKSEKSDDPKLLKGTLTGMPDTSIVKTTTTIADSPKSKKSDDPGTAYSSTPKNHSPTTSEQHSVTEEEPNSAVMFWVGFIVVFVFVFVMVIWIAESVNPIGYNRLRSRYRCSSEIPLIHVDRPESY